MKKYTYLLIISLFALFSFTLPNEDSAYEGGKISYNVEKGRGFVTINLGLQNPQEYSKIVILRSDNAFKYFRDVKYLGYDQIKSLDSDNILIDRYPLPGGVTSYYKVQTVDKNGVQKTYPSVKLSLSK